MKSKSAITLPQASNVFWGVDISTSRVDIGWSGPDIGSCSSSWSKNLRDGQRLDTAYEQTLRLARLLVIDRPAIFAYIEQPSGRYGKPTLVAVAGVIWLGVWQALRDHWGKPVEVRMVTSAHWKRVVVADDGYSESARFGKPDDDSMYPALSWARAHGYEGDSYDAADTICIAECARRDVQLLPA